MLKGGLLVLLCFILSCKDGLFDGGIETKREIMIDQSFSSIEIKNTFDIVLVQDTVNKALVTCGKNLQSYVSVGVENNVLMLDQDTKFKWSRKYERIKLELHLTEAPTIKADEPINLKSKGVLKGDKFILNNSAIVNEVDVNLDVRYCGIFMVSDNAGYFKIKGKCYSAYLEGWGSCQVRADSLVVSNDCYIEHRGMGDVYVNAVSLLSASIEFTGNVYYTGHPTQIIVNRKSTGQLINLDN